MYKVVIVEDDKMVAAINRQYVEMNSAFRVVGIFYNGRDGLRYLEQHPADLVILDYYMPLMDGRQFLQGLNQIKHKPDVIMVTAANEAETVRTFLHSGVNDYLVKPFEFIRFEQALQRFIQKRELWGYNSVNLNQKEVDKMLFGDRKLDGRLHLKKGMHEHTLETIRQYLRENQQCSFTSEEIAAQVSLSRVTVRRYLNYLTETHEIASSVDYKTGGRPSIIYQYL